MNSDTWTNIDAYFAGAFIAEDSLLSAVRTANAQAGLPAIDVTPSQGKLLQLLVQIHQAKRILEIGTLGGYSTLWMARALPADGLLVTLETDPHHASVASANFQRAGFAHLIRLVPGKALETLPQVQRDYPGPFDLIFIDADKVNTPDYFEWGLKLSRPGTVILVDNVVRRGEILQADTADPNVQGMRRLTAQLAREPRVSATALQTVGAKGHDGFILARVRA